MNTKQIPAFPFVVEIEQENAPTAKLINDGMTLRDYFAAKAMLTFNSATATPQMLSKWSYEMADAMMAERGKNDS